jgi:hypothetical protein
MAEQKTLFDKAIIKVKNNPMLAVVIQIKKRVFPHWPSVITENCWLLAD